MTEQKSKKLWGGRFSEAMAASVEKFSESISYDVRLYKYDIAGSKAHATMLSSQGIISPEELEQIIAGLSSIEADIEAGVFEFKTEYEDVHMNIEQALVDRIGAAGSRLHAARSRNDQIALDFKMYLRDQCDHLVELLDGACRAFTVVGRKYLGDIMPGYTHTQRAQPVLITHHMLAYYEMFRRDRDRILDCRKRLNLSPLGCAAMAGTGLPINREQVAKALGFAGVTANSMDTSADRDYAIELTSCLTMIQLHLSRLAEELVTWSTSEYKFVDISDSFCTGSSIMPQKKNPDIAELIRGKSGRVVGSLISLITMMKGLPLTYNRDQQEDKEPVFDAIDTVSASLSITAEMMAHMKFNTARCAEATETGFITATDLADYLVMKDVPFRQAHHIVGSAVAACIAKGCELPDLTLTEMQEFSPVIESDVFAVLTAEGSVNSRVSTGGTGLVRVTEALTLAEKCVGIA
ncbi:argininosuccinate lyase [Desulfotalea psychrophila]|uniref:Argininosuccinate lyase n=1 Tax=Desulfotalea psychrophila (strain LSv54 / DSM 12343) TaxID=177439 RepID=ARLY_DESPS|nr:argininosuccinate lyase [Desulfotalea psychrophila]Q6AR60.1 RecName: Full=Argininosuccinate lyase; Short=ASAL; AltName: Full=Arginosuccinase [Desulfotalea psychrophila LSv54]CAG35164.1 probable argininosuccinate lyase [Desulfotalea psychrophila LSv54]